MDLNQLHFAHPLWLWGGIAVPLLWIAFLLFYRTQRSVHQLEKFIDSHLLPYLLVNKAHKEKSIWKTFLLWSVVWSFLTLALAGPRWSFREMETFSQDQSLVILLDLSESMNATDIKPSRLVRAKQKIEDLLNISKGVKIGLIAFAADSHMITPITDDKETIRHLLPSLDTDLVYVQGSRLSPALVMASTMLESESGNNKALLVISDGGFEDSIAIVTAKKMAEKGIVIHVMGVGTTEGAPIFDKRNAAKKGTPIISKLEKDRLTEISLVGNGRYLEAHYSDHDEITILKELEKRAEAQVLIGKKNQFWDERFYLIIFPVLPIILWWFRRGYVFAMILLLLTPTVSVEASVKDYFKNSEELGKQALEDNDFETAINTFQDPYRKGVANYKAGNYVEAEKMFRQSAREEVASSSAYNIGNSLVKQGKYEDAITAYEEVLKKWPDHIKAKENLELLKKMIAQDKPNHPKSKKSDKEDKKDKSPSDDKDKNEKQDSKNGTNDPEGSQKDQQDDDADSEDQEKEPKDQQPKTNDNSDNQGNSEQTDKDSDPLENSEQTDKCSEPQEEQQGPEEKEDNKDQGGEAEQQEAVAANEDREKKAPRSQEDQDADLWLNRITNDPKTFLKNKFYIESKKCATKEGIDPW